MSVEEGGATRTLVIHCPDWPVTAADVEADEAAIVVRANRVMAASPAARQAGITTGLRRRESQRRCPQVTVITHDPARDARAFEPLASVLDAITPGVEVSRPGTIAFATRGPSRYFGGDAALAERTTWMAIGALGSRARVQVGIADGAFAALLAAHDAVGPEQPSVIPTGASPSFLAPQPVDTLIEATGDADLVDTLRRLGLRTLGLVADLPATDVLARFGTDGVMVHRVASGLDPRPLDARRPAPDLTVTREIDPPADRVDRAAFVAKALADELHGHLAGNGLACTHVLVEAETTTGEHLARRWRHEGALTAGALADRVRWQLDGWIGGSSPARPTGGIARLTLVPVEVVAARGRQLGFWGGETLVDERILRAVARVQGQLGMDAVTVPECRGGRDPADRVVRVPAAAVDLTAPRPAARASSVTAPWPGQIPAPAPALVAATPEAVEVTDADGHRVGVSGRGEVTAAPVTLACPGRDPVAVVAWAGPWPVDERWWDPERHRRRARFQILDAEGVAHLVSVEGGQWWRDATYD